jgi:hypothetical protein
MRYLNSVQFLGANSYSLSIIYIFTLLYILNWQRHIKHNTQATEKKTKQRFN